MDTAYTRYLDKCYVSAHCAAQMFPSLAAQAPQTVSAVTPPAPATAGQLADASAALNDVLAGSNSKE